MPKVIITTQVEDAAKWEKNFKTHPDVLKTYGLGAPVHYAISGNELTICMEPSDIDTFMKAVQSKQTIDAMTSDGVNPEAVKMVVLDKELKV